MNSYLWILYGAGGRLSYMHRSKVKDFQIVFIPANGSQQTAQWSNWPKGSGGGWMIYNSNISCMQPFLHSKLMRQGLSEVARSKIDCSASIWYYEKWWKIQINYIYSLAFAIFISYRSGIRDSNDISQGQIVDRNRGTEFSGLYYTRLTQADAKGWNISNFID